MADETTSDAWAIDVRAKGLHPHAVDASGKQASRHCLRARQG